MFKKIILTFLLLVFLQINSIANANNFSLEKVEVLGKNVLELKFNRNLQKSDYLNDSFKLINNIKEELIIDKAEIIDKNMVRIFLDENMKPKQLYKITVLELLDIEWNWIKEGYNAAKEFETPKVFNLFNHKKVISSETEDNTKLDKLIEKQKKLHEKLKNDKENDYEVEKFVKKDNKKIEDRVVELSDNNKIIEKIEDEGPELSEIQKIIQEKIRRKNIFLEKQKEEKIFQENEEKKKKIEAQKIIQEKINKKNNQVNKIKKTLISWKLSKIAILYKQGKYREAEILNKEILEDDVNNQEAKQYAVLIEKKLEKSVSNLSSKEWSIIEKVSLPKEKSYNNINLEDKLEEVDILYFEWKYKEAKILNERILEKTPDNIYAKKYINLIEEKIESNQKIKNKLRKLTILYKQKKYKQAKDTVKEVLFIDYNNYKAKKYVSLLKTKLESENNLWKNSIKNRLKDLNILYKQEKYEEAKDIVEEILYMDVNNLEAKKYVDLIEEKLISTSLIRENISDNNPEKQKLTNKQNDNVENNISGWIAKNDDSNTIIVDKMPTTGPTETMILLLSLLLGLWFFVRKKV